MFRIFTSCRHRAEKCKEVGNALLNYTVHEHHFNLNFNTLVKKRHEFDDAQCISMPWPEKSAGVSSRGGGRLVLSAVSATWGYITAPHFSRFLRHALGYGGHIHNIITLTYKVQYIKFEWSYRNQTHLRVAHTSQISHASGVGWGVKMWNFEILPDFDFAAAGSIFVLQTHVYM